MSNIPPFPSFTKQWHNKAQPATFPTRPELSAKGKSVLITGGGVGGIGGETARHFAQAGASRIAILGRRLQPLIDNKTFIEEHYPGVEVFAVPADVTKKADVDAAFAQFCSNGHKVDTLVSSAATMGPKESVALVDGAIYLEFVHAGVAAALWLAQAFAQHHSTNGGGAVVINISSWAVHWNPLDLFSVSSVAKAAASRLWETLMLSNPTVRVVHVHPGVVLSELSLSYGDGAASFAGVPVDEVSLPASFNVWLASQEANFLKGKFVWCNWDVDELKTRAEEIRTGTILNIGLVGWPFDIGAVGRALEGTTSLARFAAGTTATE
ncbi:hypothetical protein HK405_005105 [Cladochytrium tenue]|nr:hypothetical protein HK405_005105 [Cladochytrium tenue]